MLNPRSATRPAAPNTSKQRLRLWLRLLDATRRVENELRERLRLEHDTTLPRFDVLAALARHDEGLTMGGLSSALKVSNGNTTGIVDRLVSDGLVVRVPVAGDRRATRVRLTDTGQAQFGTMARAHERWVNDLLSAIGPQDLEAMTQLLERIGRVRPVTPETANLVPPIVATPDLIGTDE
jgi:DNA-binding MarR family transcriptional regulator